MDLKGQSVNRIYSVKGKKGENRFYEIWETTSIYSADIFDFHFCKQPLSALQNNLFEKIREDFLKIFDIQTPYLYKPFEAGKHGNSFYLAYPQIESNTLDVLMNAEVVFPYEIALKIVINILRGLALLEKRNLHHNMLSPEEVWLTESGRDITHIKISGFLDHHLLPSRETVTTTAEKDIHDLGIMLAEMLSGRKSGNSASLKLPSGTPAWAADLTEKMIEAPGSFASIGDLLEEILPKAPEHSILEDSIGERIEERQKGGTTEPETNSLPEERESPDQAEQPAAKTTSSVKKVKEFVSFILSIFRRKKQKDTSVNREEEPSSIEDTENTAADEAGEAPADQKIIPLEETPYNEFHRTKPAEEEGLQIDPWEIDKNRYSSQKKETESQSSVPLQHNKKTENMIFRSDASRYHRTENKRTKDTERGTQQQKKEHKEETFITAEEKIKMLKKHRENPVTGKEYTIQSPSVNPDKKVYESAANNSLETSSHRTPEKRGKKETAENPAPKEQKETALEKSDVQQQEKPRPSIFYRLIQWIKNLFTRRR